MSKKPRDRRIHTRCRVATQTQVLPVLETSLGGLVPFLPNQPVEGCVCFNGGRGGILLRTVDAPAAEQVVVAGKPIGRQAQCMVPVGTQVKIGDRIGTLVLRPVQVLAGRIPRQATATFSG